MTGQKKTPAPETGAQEETFYPLKNHNDIGPMSMARPQDDVQAGLPASRLFFNLPRVFPVVFKEKQSTRITAAGPLSIFTRFPIKLGALPLLCSMSKGEWNVNNVSRREALLNPNYTV